MKDFFAHKKKTRYLVIWADYLQLCQYNHCAAALMSVFSYWTAAQVSRGADTFIVRTRPELQQDLMGLFSMPTIDKGLKYLIEDLHILEVDSTGRRVANRYRYDYKKVYRACEDLGGDFGNQAEESAAPSTQNLDDSVLKNLSLSTQNFDDSVLKNLSLSTQNFDDSYIRNKEYIKEEEQRIEKQEPISPLPIQASQALPLSEPETQTPFEADSFRFYWNRQRSKKLNKAEAERAAQVLSSSGYYMEQIERAVNVFFQDDFWAQAQPIKFPIAAFLKGLARFVDAGEDNRAPAINLPPPEVSWYEVPDIPIVRKQPDPASIPARLTAWNAIVPADMQMAIWDKMHATAAMSDAERQPLFVDNFDFIVTRCVALKTDSNINLKPDYLWLFRESKGKPNWYQVYVGLWGDGTPRRSPASIAKPESMTQKLIREAKERSEKKKQALGTLVPNEQGGQECNTTKM